ncbi:short-chain alcohol dehydrogenase [Rhizina undulata]
MSALSQFRPPAPTYTEKDVPDLAGKVYIVTGGYSGVGLELTKLLYSKSARIYIAGRSEASATSAIEEIKTACPEAKGELLFLKLDLADLTGIKSSAETFLGKEGRLDVVWHNAGVMIPPNGSKTKQGYELQLGTNVLGPWLFQTFLTPLLAKTAALPDTQKNSVRVIWVSSSAQMNAPSNGGMRWDDLNFEKPLCFGEKLLPGEAWLKYSQTKAANIILAAEAARRWKETGVLSLNVILYPAYNGGLTELFAGLSPAVDESRNGSFIVPWGRFGDPRADIKAGMTEEGGNGKRLWEWCEGECGQYM